MWMKPLVLGCATTQQAATSTQLLEIAVRAWVAAIVHHVRIAPQGSTIDMFEGARHEISPAY
jgi:hypothetical protein